MKHIQVSSMFVVLILVCITGCSSNHNQDPVGCRNDNSPEFFTCLNDHSVIASGMLEIDLSKMEVRNVDDRVPKVHIDITAFLGGYFRFYITHIDPPYLTLKLEIENPTPLQVYDVRIIYTDLFDKVIVNPDGWTNFFAPGGKLDAVPFNYFAKEYDYQAFPVGPGGIDDEIMELYWTPGAPPYVSYVIECSLPDNAQEPIRIHDIDVFGDLTSRSGAAVVTITVDDWQDDVTGAGILHSAFFNPRRYSLPMYRYRNTSTFKGNLFNGWGPELDPGDYPVWLKAESSNPDDIVLGWRHMQNVPDSVDQSPEFISLPDSDHERITEGMTERIQTWITNQFFETEVYWEQISPESPQGEFMGTSQIHHDARWKAPEVDETTEFLFQVTASQTEGPLLNSSMVYALPVEKILPVEISGGPWIDPDPLDENTQGHLQVEVYDRNEISDADEFSYIWEQVEPVTPEGVFWVSNNEAWWNAPEVDEDTVFKLRVTVEKDWWTPPLSASGDVDVLVKNVN